nr:MAG TPA: hypothetical protein [Caudoviricetes sp.]
MRISALKVRVLCSDPKSPCVQRGRVGHATSSVRQTIRTSL